MRTGSSRGTTASRRTYRFCTATRFCSAWVKPASSRSGRKSRREGNVLTYRASVDKDDRWTGETFDATEFVLPALGRLWVPVPGGGPLLRVLQWMYPIDRDHTYVLVWHGRKCSQ